MSKERLEEIEKRIEHDIIHNDGRMLSVRLRDAEWLVEQAKLVQELDELKNAFDYLGSDYIDLMQQNKRYREKINVALALLESVPFREPEASSAVKHLNKALESDLE